MLNLRMGRRGKHEEEEEEEFFPEEQTVEEKPEKPKAVNPLRGSTVQRRTRSRATTEKPMQNKSTLNKSVPNKLVGNKTIPNKPATNKPSMMTAPINMAISNEMEEDARGQIQKAPNPFKQRNKRQDGPKVEKSGKGKKEPKPKKEVVPKKSSGKVSKETQAGPRTKKNTQVRKNKRLSGYSKLYESEAKELKTEDIIVTNKYAYSEKSLQFKDYPVVEDYVDLNKGYDEPITNTKPKDPASEDNNISIMPDLSFDDESLSLGTENEISLDGAEELSLTDGEVIELELGENTEDGEITLDLTTEESNEEPVIELDDSVVTEDNIQLMVSELKNEEATEEFVLDEEPEATFSLEEPEDNFNLEENASLNIEEPSTTSEAIAEMQGYLNIPENPFDEEPSLQLEDAIVLQDEETIEETISLTVENEEVNAEEDLVLKYKAQEEAVAEAEAILEATTPVEEEKLVFGAKRKTEETATLNLGKTYNIDDLVIDKNKEDDLLQDGFLSLGDKESSKEEIKVDKYSNQEELLVTSKTFSEALQHLR